METPEKQSSPEKQEYIAFVRHCVQTDAIKLISGHKQYTQFLHDPEVAEEVKILLVDKLKKADLVRAKEIIDTLAVSQETFEGVFLDYFSNHAPTFGGQEAMDVYSKMMTYLPLTAEFLASARFQNVFIEKVCQTLEGSDNNPHGPSDYYTKHCIQELKLDPSVLDNERVKVVAKKYLLRHVLTGNHFARILPIKSVRDSAARFFILDIFEDSVFKEAVRKRVPILGSSEILKEYIDICHLDQSDIEQNAKETFLAITSGDKTALERDLYGEYVSSRRDKQSVEEKLMLIAGRYQLDTSTLETGLSKYLEITLQDAKDRREKDPWGPFGFGHNFSKIFTLFAEGSPLRPYMELPACKAELKKFVLGKLVDYFTREFARTTQPLLDAKAFMKGTGIDGVTLDEVAEACEVSMDKMINFVASWTMGKPFGEFITEQQTVFRLSKEQITQIFGIVSLRKLDAESIFASVKNSWGRESVIPVFLKRVADVEKDAQTAGVEPPRELIQDEAQNVLYMTLEQTKDHYGRLSNKRKLIDEMRSHIELRPDFLAQCGADLLETEVLERFNYRWGDTHEGRFYPEHEEIIQAQIGEIQGEVEIIIKDLGVSREQIKNIVEAKLVELRNKKGFEREAEILYRCFLTYMEEPSNTSPEEALKQNLESISAAMYRGQMGVATQLVKLKNITLEQLKDSEATKRAMKVRLGDYLRSGGSRDSAYIASMVEWIEMFLPGSTASDILELNAEATERFKNIRRLAPQLADRYMSSIETFLLFYPNLTEAEKLDELLVKYPFIADALVGNERFGVKLLFQFRKLDQLSKSNIAFLFTKAKELSDQGIELDSPEFRIAIQEQLLGYRSNSLISEALRREGVDVEAWLTYKEEVYVELGESEQSASKQIEEAVTRIKESLKLFLAHHKAVVKDFEKELTEFKIPAQDKSQLEADLAVLQTKISGTTDERVRSGLLRGIQNIEEQLASPKMVSVWNRFNGEMQRITVLQKEIFSSFEKLQSKEKELTELQASDMGPREKRKEVQKIKGEIQKIKVSLVEKTAKVGEQVDTMEAKLIGLLAEPLGKERAESLAQEIAEKIGEPLDHTRTDIKTIENSLTGTDSLEGTGLRIGLWNRNPNEDLYLGNYTGCCVRIDSDHLGSECAIADYLTDVGMHVVTIVDEKKKIPVAAAWCWIGKDDNDNVVLVIDNIEANTSYSAKYRSAIEPKLKKYFEAFAKAIGVPRVVQGLPHNDLWAAPKLTASYYKVGGFNRPSGYYLEGEDAGGDGPADEGDWEPEDQQDEEDEGEEE